MPVFDLPPIPAAPVPNEQALRLLAGRAIHRPTDMGMKEVVALATAVIGLLDRGGTFDAAPMRKAAAS